MRPRMRLPSTGPYGKHWRHREAWVLPFADVPGLSSKDIEHVAG